MINKVENIAETHFELTMKHFGTAATDVFFSVDLDVAKHVVEVTMNPAAIDSWMLSLFARDQLAAQRGIDTIVWQRSDWRESRPKWKLILIMNGARYAVKIVEVFAGAIKEFTVIFSPVPLPLPEEK